MKKQETGLKRAAGRVDWF